MCAARECHKASRTQNMEKVLERQADDLITGPGVTGVLCSDNQGLTLTVRGNAQITSAGLISNLAQQARMLHPDMPSTPVICIESDQGNVLIKSEGQVTMSVYKMTS